MQYVSAMKRSQSQNSASKLEALLVPFLCTGGGYCFVILDEGAIQVRYRTIAKLSMEWIVALLFVVFSYFTQQQQFYKAWKNKQAGWTKTTTKEKENNSRTNKNRYKTKTAVGHENLLQFYYRLKSQCGHWPPSPLPYSFRNGFSFQNSEVA